MITVTNLLSSFREETVAKENISFQSAFNAIYCLSDNW